MNIAALALSNLLTAAEFTAWILFAVLAFLAAVSTLFYWQKFKVQKQQILLLRDQIAKFQEELSMLQELENLVPELKKIAHLDHDVNTPLCVITMSLGRAKKLGQEAADEALLNNVNDIMSAVSKIGEIMQAVRVLKTSSLISYKDHKAAETKTGNTYEH
jgi:signal transduction histidine kinase